MSNGKTSAGFREFLRQHQHAAAPAAAATPMAAPAVDRFAVDLENFAERWGGARNGVAGNGWYTVTWVFRAGGGDRLITFSSPYGNFTVQFGRRNAMIREGARLAEVWLITAILDSGLINVAKELCPIARLREIARVGFRARMFNSAPSRKLLIHVHTRHSLRSALSCPDDYHGLIIRLLGRLRGTRTGHAVLMGLSRLGEELDIICKPGELKVRTKSSDGDTAVLFADASKLFGQTYYAIQPIAGGGAQIVRRNSPPAALLGHELIHVLNEKVNREECALRTRARDGSDWTCPEEELAIKGYIRGQRGAAADISECHLLVELGMPIRYGHSGATVAALTAAEMDACYGVGWAARYGLGGVAAGAAAAVAAAAAPLAVAAAAAPLPVAAAAAAPAAAPAATSAT